MQKFTVEKNEYLSKDINAFYHTDYLGYGKPGNPDYINHLKNTKGDYSYLKLERAVEQLKRVIRKDLHRVVDYVDSNDIVICVMPRAKAKNEYSEDQLLFSSTVSKEVDLLTGRVTNGCNFIVRRVSTRTTHLRNFDKSGSLPYINITKDTCEISDQVKGKDVILVDDVYTKGVNVIEDAIQALFDSKAKSVTLYVVAKTKYRKNMG